MQVVGNTFSPCVKMVFKEDIKNIFISRQNQWKFGPGISHFPCPGDPTKGNLGQTHVSHWGRHGSMVAGECEVSWSRRGKLDTAYGPILLPYLQVTHFLLLFPNGLTNSWIIVHFMTVLYTTEHLKRGASHFNYINRRKVEEVSKVTLERREHSQQNYEFPTLPSMQI